MSFQTLAVCSLLLVLFYIKRTDAAAVIIVLKFLLCLLLVRCFEVYCTEILFCFYETVKLFCEVDVVYT